MFVKEPIKNGKLNFGKYNGVDLIKVFKEDRVYFEWCNTHVQGFEFPRESLFELYKDSEFVNEFLISDDLAAILEGDPVGERVLKLRNKKAIGNISAIKLSDKSESIDMICYKEEGKKKLDNI